VLLLWITTTTVIGETTELKESGGDVVLDVLPIRQKNVATELDPQLQGHVFQHHIRITAFCERIAFRLKQVTLELH